MTRITIKQLSPTSLDPAVKPRRIITTTSRSPSVTGVVTKIEPVRAKLDLSNPANIIRTSANNHSFVNVGVPRMKGKCVTCLKNGKSNLERLTTCCDSCPGSNWMCESCFEDLH
ncbi:hypothetical protein ACLKA6_003069 [Drosophila palustris]